MKPWHLLMAWVLSRKIRHQHRELAKYIRRSAYEITAWKQDIGFLDEQLRYHQLASDSSIAAETLEEMTDHRTASDTVDDGSTEAADHKALPTSHLRVDGSD